MSRSLMISNWRRSSKKKESILKKELGNIKTNRVHKIISRASKEISSRIKVMEVEEFLIESEEYLTDMLTTIKIIKLYFYIIKPFSWFSFEKIGN